MRQEQHSAAVAAAAAAAAAKTRQEEEAQNAQVLKELEAKRSQLDVDLEDVEKQLTSARARHSAAVSHQAEVDQEREQVLKQHEKAKATLELQELQTTVPSPNHLCLQLTSRSPSPPAPLQHT